MTLQGVHEVCQAGVGPGPAGGGAEAGGGGNPTVPGLGQTLDDEGMTGICINIMQNNMAMERKRG